MRPPCSCHNEPQRWQKDNRCTDGGYFYCAVLARERDRATRRKQGVLPVDQRPLVPEPAYRTVHHRARKAYSGQPCAHCGDTRRLTVALRHDGSPSARRRDGRGRTFSILVDDYLPLCRQCHVDYDGVSERVKTWHATRAA